MPAQKTPGFEQLPERMRAFPASERYLIGVSGGRDSIALLHWLAQHAYRRLIVCHLDHGLRGRVSRADALFVRRLTEKWKLRCENQRVDVRDLAATKKLSLEAAGRRARLEFFTAVARRRRCRTIFLAHHADDQVETFLLRLFRGAGGRGLGAMREVSRIGGLQIVRPLLGVWRPEIDEFVRQHRLKFRDDASNADQRTIRNLLRAKIIPRLEKEFGRRLKTNLWRAANILAEEDALLETLLPNELASPNESPLATRTMRELPVVLQRRAILRWLRAHNVGDIGFDLIEKVRALLAPGAKISRTNLPGNRFVRRRAGKLFIE